MSENNKAPEGHSKACEYAKHDKCECKCNGAFHMIHTKKEITEYHIEKMNEKNNNNGQMTLDSFINGSDSTDMENDKSLIHTDQKTIQNVKILGSEGNSGCKSHQNQLLQLREALHKITGSAAVNSVRNQDKALELIRQIKELGEE